MVSKIAVMALVAVVAVPILLGYGLNFESEDREYYTPTGNSTDVTPLLSQGTAYNLIDASTYSLNSDVNFYRGPTPGGDYLRIFPHYIKVNQTYNTPIKQGVFYFDRYLTDSYDDFTTTLDQLTLVNVLNPSTWNVKVQYVDDQNNTVWSGVINDVHSVFYAKTYNAVYIYAGSNNYVFKNPMGVMQNGQITGWQSYDGSFINNYSDISGGWLFPSSPATFYNAWHAPADAESVLFTINLDSINPAENSTSFNVRGTDGNTDRLFSFYRSNGFWGVRNNYVIDSNTDLPYSADISDNTYQVLITRTGFEVRYIGSWPDTIGPAQYYWSKSFEWRAQDVISPSDFITHFFNTASGYNSMTTAALRVDAAKVVSSSYRLISNTTYTPDYLTGHTNPITTLTNAVKLGTSLTFAGHTYTVNGSSIMMGTHKVPIEGLELTSVPDGNGQYENAINGTVIGTTATPGAITFTGNWGVSVSTASQTSETVHVTKWVPGNFAWNGIDTNFKMAGLLASLGAFIGLAIYGRRSGARVLPLLLVCGGAAFVFLLMI